MYGVSMSSSKHLPGFKLQKEFIKGGTLVFNNQGLATGELRIVQKGFEIKVIFRDDGAIIELMNKTGLSKLVPDFIIMDKVIKEVKNFKGF
jgi:hypothetical protein